MDTYRSDFVDKDFLTKALRNVVKHDDQVEIVSFKSIPAMAKGENFLGDLATVEFMAKITDKSGQDTYRSFKWIIKLLLPDTGNDNIDIQGLAFHKKKTFRL